jgi:hypothetical protein
MALLKHNIDNYKINIKSISNDTIEILAKISHLVYKQIINKEFYEHFLLIKQVLEEHISSNTKHSLFFTMHYEDPMIKLNFVLNLEHIQENITLKLYRRYLILKEPEHDDKIYIEKIKVFY